MPLYSIGDKRVELRGAHHYIAHDATLVGAITLEADANIWFKVVIRAENDMVRIGEATNVQDGSVLHVDPGFPLTLGNRVTIGHKVMLHGCTVGDGALVGINSVVMNGARIGKGSLTWNQMLASASSVMAPTRVASCATKWLAPRNSTRLSPRE